MIMMQYHLWTLYVRKMQIYDLEASGSGKRYASFEACCLYYKTCQVELVFILLKEPVSETCLCITGTIGTVRYASVLPKGEGKEQTTCAM
jgi:hypothetical protein